MYVRVQLVGQVRFLKQARIAAVLAPASARTDQVAGHPDMDILSHSSKLKTE
jgi:hypothetical protein